MKKKELSHKIDSSELLTAIVANSKGEIFELDEYAAVGMSGNYLYPISVAETIELPFGSELMMMPDRSPLLFHKHRREFETVSVHPYSSKEPIFPVAAFNSPGYVISSVSAYEERSNARYLPLFSYGAVGWYHGHFRSTAILVDPEKRQDLRYMKPQDVKHGVRKVRKIMPNNRLREHLEACALVYSCPAGKNFFLGRYEAPLPTSQHCNARCLGCISLQQQSDIPTTQNRINFTPTPEEIAEVAVYHIKRVRQSIVSFGQGCEGDPLFAANVIEPAIRLIRSQTSDGTINMNTNGSLPDILNKLFDAGLDSIRISMNSTRKECYEAYFRPKGYSFSDVLESIRIGIERNKFVSINYLNSPGFTDTPQEIESLYLFLQRYPIHLIQWRNLNYDPARYWKVMNQTACSGHPMGMRTLLERIKHDFPKLKHGYFNPPKETFGLS